MPGKCVTYSRVSTNDGDQNTDNQAVILRDWAQKLGMTIEKEYIDHASGGTGDRPSFKQMFEDIKCVKKDTLTVLFWSLDRFSREGAFKTMTYLNTLEVLGVSFKSHSESWLDSAGPFSSVIIAMLATLAQQEKVRIRERTKAGLARVRREGTKSGKPIGRPVVNIDMDQAKRLLESHSERKTAEILGISPSGLRLKLHGKAARKIKAVWSEPVSGRIDADGFFIEDESGEVVIRYDRMTNKPHCINHKGELDACRDRHMEVMA